MPLSRNKTMARRQAGFTLVELMVVVVIVGILAAIAYPSYQDSVRKAKRVEGRGALMQLMQQEERFYSQHNRYADFTATSGSKDAFKWFSGDNPDSSAYEIKAEACAGESIANCVQLTADPGGANVGGKFKDPLCGSLTLSSIGEKSPAKSECWK